MKKYLSLSLIIASSLFLSACGVKNSSNNSSDSSNNSTSSFSLRDLIAKNIPQKCIYSGSNQEGSFESEIIINGKKFKQILSAKSAEGEQIINSISDGQYVYTWGSQFDQTDFAIKTKADFDTTSDVPKEESSQMAYEQIDLDSEFQGNCSPVVVSDADFEPPKDINFQDYSQFLEDIKSSFPEMDLTDLE